MHLFKPHLASNTTKSRMASVEIVQATEATTRSINEPPRISFSAEFLDENSFISISPHSETSEKDQEKPRINAEFEFLSNNNGSSHTMLTADELFFEGKLLPFWQTHHSEQLNKISLKPKDAEKEVNKEAAENRASWLVDDDPSPRPPKCTVLWKELLRLKKQGGSSLSSSSSSSSTSYSSSSLTDVAATTEAKAMKEGAGSREKQQVKRVSKGLQRTRSASIRIRPIINVPLCTQVKSSAVAPPFLFKKGRLER
ncbi:uncharacterized protein LOC123212199 [Mangifera indica]|uniref:uncharacterized protein LOC123212199 n=1 Tax=Mangifera indica TaxID=29780 RepID=UPI001CFA76BD|nr:uncharacterized protein LOC123212199 [Mangifera indica]